MSKDQESSKVDIYPVGLLSDLKRLRAEWWTQGSGVAVVAFVSRFRASWRRRSYWNGYLAETDLPWAKRAGHGWTKRRATLDLARHVAEIERQAR
jgi:hypothetical protein